MKVPKIVISVTFSLILSGVSKKVRLGPSGIEFYRKATCHEFGKNARFNPYSVVGYKWFVFYSWGPNDGGSVYEFFVPTKADLEYLHRMIDDFVEEPVNWTARHVLVKCEHQGLLMLLVEQNDRGHYLGYQLFRKYKNKPEATFCIKPLQFRVVVTSSPSKILHADMQKGVNKIEAISFILKQKAGYIGWMTCPSEAVRAMSKLSEIPPQNLLQEAASTLGHHGRGGKTYLNQGNDWMPIPDLDEHQYFRRPYKKNVFDKYIMLQHFRHL